jgi:hypothetical protein
MSLRWAIDRRSRNTLICRVSRGGCASRFTPAVRDRDSLNRPRQKALCAQAAALPNGARQRVEARGCPEGIQAVNVIRLGMSFRGGHLVAADKERRARAVLRRLHLDQPLLPRSLEGKDVVAGVVATSA